MASTLQRPKSILARPKISKTATIHQSLQHSRSEMSHPTLMQRHLNPTQFIGTITISQHLQPILNKDPHTKEFRQTPIPRTVTLLRHIPLVLPFFLQKTSIKWILISRTVPSPERCKKAKWISALMPVLLCKSGTSCGTQSRL